MSAIGHMGELDEGWWRRRTRQDARVPRISYRPDFLTNPARSTWSCRRESCVCGLEARSTITSPWRDRSPVSWTHRWRLLTRTPRVSRSFL